MQGTKLQVIADAKGNFITAHARNNEGEDSGFSFVHCKVEGTGSGAYLGRAWMSRPRVVFAYTTMSGVVNPQGWSNNFHPERDQYVFNPSIILNYFIFCLVNILKYNFTFFRVQYVNE